MNLWDKLNLYSVKPKKKKRHKKKGLRPALKTRKIIDHFQKELCERKTEAEILFQSFLEKHNIDFKFQKIIRSKKQYYIVDFFLPQWHTVVEIDGKYHSTVKQTTQDFERTQNLLANNMIANIIRFTNEEIQDLKLELFKERLLQNELLSDLTTDAYPIPEEDGRINKASVCLHIAK